MMELPNVLTVDTFLTWESAQADAHEFIAGEIVAMSNPTRAHGRILRRLRNAFEAVLPSDCDMYTNEITVKLPNAATRPDISVTCDERDRRPEDDEASTIEFPKLIVEVLSPSTARYDLGEKVTLYFSIPTVQEYVIIDPRKRFVVAHKRVGDTITAHYPLNSFRLQSVGLNVDLDYLYR